MMSYETSVRGITLCHSLCWLGSRDEQYDYCTFSEESKLLYVRFLVKFISFQRKQARRSLEASSFRFLRYHARMKTGGHIDQKEEREKSRKQVMKERRDIKEKGKRKGKGKGKRKGEEKERERKKKGNS